MGDGESREATMCPPSAGVPMEVEASNDTTEPVVIKDLTFQYTALSGLPVTRNLDLTLQRGTRALLIGSNGAGKTTLLNVLGGKHMCSKEAVQILGQTAFSNTHPLVTVLSGQWSKQMAGGAGTPYQNDVSVPELLAAAKETPDPERLERLLHILDVDLKWRMHMVSDGQRRRVQILMALLKPFEVLLLDEVTVDLDVVARADLLDFLKEETEVRGATILYATHIFDGLDEWATHLAYLSQGKVQRFAPIEEYEDPNQITAKGSISPLLDLVETWLREERGVLLEEKKLKQELQLQQQKQKEQQDAEKAAKKPNTSSYDPFAGKGRRKQINYGW